MVWGQRWGGCDTCLIKQTQVAQCVHLEVTTGWCHRMQCLPRYAAYALSASKHGASGIFQQVPMYMTRSQIVWDAAPNPDPECAARCHLCWQNWSIIYSAVTCCLMFKFVGQAIAALTQPVYTILKP